MYADFTADNYQENIVAQRTRVELVDDLTGEEIAEGQGETITYAIDGDQYQIDLNKKNAAEFRKSFEKYLNVSRKASGGSGRGRRSSSSRGSSRNYDINELRQWAASNGIQVAPRGRVKSEIVEQFLASKS